MATQTQEKPKINHCKGPQGDDLYLTDEQLRAGLGIGLEIEVVNDNFDMGDAEKQAAAKASDKVQKVPEVTSAA